MHTWPDLNLTHLLDLFSNIIKPQAWMSGRLSVRRNIQQQQLSNISCLFSPPLCMRACVCVSVRACVRVCVNRIWLCGLWQPCSSPEGCGLAQSQWRPGTDGEGKLHPICHPPFLIIKVVSGAVILLRDSVTVFKPWSKLRWALLASEVIADDISSQVTNIDRSIDNNNSNNYVIHWMWVSLIYVRLMGAIWGQRWNYWFSPYRAIDEQHAYLAIIDLIPEKVKESLQQIFEFPVILHSSFSPLWPPFTSILCVFILLTNNSCCCCQANATMQCQKHVGLTSTISLYSNVFEGGTE